MEIFETRDEWLLAAKRILDDALTSAGLKPADVRASVGFPVGNRGGKNGKSIGICHYDAKDKTPQVWIHPEIDDPLRVLDILAHELIHAYLPMGAGHGPKFGKPARHIGLDGSLTATTAGPEFSAIAQNVVEVLGDYPHSKLTYEAARGRKQTTRQILVDCPCGIKYRASRKVLESIQDLRCPDGHCHERPTIVFPNP